MFGKYHKNYIAYHMSQCIWQVPDSSEHDNFEILIYEDRYVIIDQNDLRRALSIQRTDPYSIEDVDYRTVTPSFRDSVQVKCIFGVVVCNDSDRRGRNFTILKMDIWDMASPRSAFPNDSYPHLVACVNSSRVIGIKYAYTIWEVTEAALFPLCPQHVIDESVEGKELFRIEDRLKKMLESGGFYYGLRSDVLNNYQHLSTHGVIQHRRITENEYTPEDQKGLKPGSSGPYIERLSSLGRRFSWNEQMVKNYLFLRNKTCATKESFADGLTHDAAKWIRILFQGAISPPLCIQGKLAACIIARRSSFRGGTRYNHRGIDDSGNVANFVETEFLLLASDKTFSVDASYIALSDAVAPVASLETEIDSFLDTSPISTLNSKKKENNKGANFNVIYSHIQVRGSVPCFWSQNSGSLHISIDREAPFTSKATNYHFRDLDTRYGGHTLCVNLTKGEGVEHGLTSHWEAVRNYTKNSQFLQNDNTSSYELINHDFHGILANHNGQIDKLYEHLILNTNHRDTGYFCSLESIADHEILPGYGKKSSIQRGVIRTNCVDCLDRTNAAQLAFSISILESFLHNSGFVFGGECDSMAENKDANSAEQNVYKRAGVATRGSDYSHSRSNHRINHPSLIERVSEKSNYRNVFPRVGESCTNPDIIKTLPNFIKDVLVRLWMIHGDRISLHYTGTGSVLTKLVEKGRRTWYSKLSQNITSATRYVINNLEDNNRQLAINCLFGRLSGHELPEAVPNNDPPVVSDPVGCMHPFSPTQVDSTKMLNRDKTDSMIFSDSINSSPELSGINRGNRDHLTIWTGTWNVNGKNLWNEIHLANWFRIPDKQHIDDSTIMEPLFDMYVIGVQEFVELDVSSLIKRGFKSLVAKTGAVQSMQYTSEHKHRKSDLSTAVLELLNNWNEGGDGRYVELGTTTLVGLLIMVFVKEDVCGDISNVVVSKAKTGLGGAHGNKGAVILSMDITPNGRLFDQQYRTDPHSTSRAAEKGNETSFDSRKSIRTVFICAHLEAGSNAENRSLRSTQLSSILMTAEQTAGIPDLFKFNPQIKPGKGSTRCNTPIAVWLLGDLNFRSVTARTIKSDRRNSIDESETIPCLKAFSEGDFLSFMPTYKYVVGTSNFCNQREPSWTDRILFFETGGSAHENFDTNSIPDQTQIYIKDRIIELISYKSHPKYIISDHKPVSATFTVCYPFNDQSVPGNRLLMTNSEPKHHEVKPIAPSIINGTPECTDRTYRLETSENGMRHRTANPTNKQHVWYL